MSKCFAIALSVLVLIQSLNIGADNIMQLDELIEHAKFHKQEHGDSFLVFLSKHYGELKSEHSKNHQEEENEHEKLPFQYQASTSSLIGIFSEYSTSDSSNLEVFKTVDSNFYYLNLYALLRGEELLQPPKYA